MEDLDVEWKNAYKTELFQSSFNYQLYGQNLPRVAKAFADAPLNVTF